MKYKKNKQDGFTMIELIAAIAILSIGIIGIYEAFFPFVPLSYRLSYRLTASYLAQDGLEIIRNIRDNNFVQGLSGSSWSTGLLICSFGCQADYKTGTSQEAEVNQLQSYGGGNFLNFNSDGFYSYDAGTATKFKRRITITQVSSDVLSVYVQVFWDYSGQSYTFDTEEYLYNWY
ncbi:MAG: hypothetical protein A3F47_00975 [Candidatus Staskawiczbacteria bacterium RIFCSPHIGHO2_12_FULL_38_11]|uniref:Prepilin-type N-terminal cleavage/methylation domain-containing protein n=1 Tax=Candidatus Staskawiczbacteria bacterium RIFCSPHIGHO2_12_FULL_38_11 TaxID=1802209 RepID=A0A1G2I424_9BACT|nr:MAG: hypothetical protein A3F47_00975 [Candidatus Staskawiczbacteria bacterium RIFCSPHIGHO2_12_FULL_38_11]